MQSSTHCKVGTGIYRYLVRRSEMRSTESSQLKKHVNGRSIIVVRTIHYSITLHPRTTRKQNPPPPVEIMAY